MISKRRPTGLSIAISSTLASSKKSQPLLEKRQSSEFTIKIANSLEEKEIVYRMAYRIYLDKGYIQKNPNEWLVKNYDEDDETIVLVVKDKNKNIAGSVTLVFDESSRLPAQKIYHDEIQFLKSSNEKIVEISRLVISHDYRNSKEILVLLFNYLVIYSSLIKKYTGLAIEVNPRHKNYYKELLCFTEIGGEKPCPSVQNAPANLLYLPISKYRSELCRCQNTANKNKKERSLYKYFIKPEQESLAAHYLRNQARPVTVEEKMYFGFSNSDSTKSFCL